MAIVRRKQTTTAAAGVTTVAKEQPKQIYTPHESIKWASTGCPVLNLSLSGNVDDGLPIGHVVNAIGEHTTGKTLLLCEVINNIWYVEHKQRQKKVLLAINEPENKFNFDLAIDNGLPASEIIWEHSATVEEWLEWQTNILNQNVGKYDIIFIGTDSLDGFDNLRAQKAAKKRGTGTQDFKVGLANTLDRLFKESRGLIKKANCINYMVSQVRDNINAKPWEKKKKRAGGNALNHNATIIFWLGQRGDILHDNGTPQGVRIEVEVEKNHAGQPSRPVRFNILYGYGIDYIGSTVDFAREIECLDNVIKRGGSWYSYKGATVGQGDGVVVPFLETNPEAYNDLLDALQVKWDALIEEAKLHRRPKWPTQQQ